jgi:hypothetical protein
MKLFFYPNSKEAYRQDCNIAVNLLQRNPSEFVNHSYNALPLNLRERLKSYMSSEELSKLELEDPDRTDRPRQELRNNPSSFMKLPVFQPTAAAAMMYQMQNISLQQRKVKKQEEQSSTGTTDNFCAINLEDEDDESSKGKPQHYGQPKSPKEATISSGLIAQVLRKDSDSKSSKSFKLFPYICLRCKKNVIICDSPSQTNPDDFNDPYLKVMVGSATKNIFSDHLLRSKTVAWNMSSLASSSANSGSSTSCFEASTVNSGLLGTHFHHQKCASTDLSALGNSASDSFYNQSGSNGGIFRSNSRNRLDHLQIQKI